MLDEAFRELRDVHEAILVHADVYERTEIDYVAHRAG